MLSRERRQFFLRWLKNPKDIGVPIASSKRLCNAMAAQLSVKQNEVVVELGAGDGAVTSAILSAGLEPKQLIIVERDSRFFEQLRHRFPEVLILKGDARNLRELLHHHGIKQVGAIVSSLPLLSMPDAVRHAIVHTAFEVIKPDGMFIQYTYGLLSPVPQKHQRAIGIKGRIAGQVWRNFPPARVWRYTAGLPG